MPTPFPGMDPYLERRSLWPAVHTRLIVAIADDLAPRIRPRYRVDIELRTYVALMSPQSPAGIPDVLVLSSPQETDDTTSAGTAGIGMPQTIELPMPEEVRERYLVVRDVATEDVITVIELLSLANKLTNEGRHEYERKRTTVLGSDTNLIEIDLLRAGEPLSPFRPEQSDYRILVSRAHDRPQADAYLFSVRDPIPEIPVPLRPDESEPVLPLNELLHDLYDRAGYDLAIDYDQSPVPPLRDEDVAWAEQVVTGAES